MTSWARWGGVFAFRHVERPLAGQKFLLGEVEFGQEAHIIQKPESVYCGILHGHPFAAGPTPVLNRLRRMGPERACPAATLSRAQTPLSLREPWSPSSYSKRWVYTGAQTREFLSWGSSSLGPGGRCLGTLDCVSRWGRNETGCVIKEWLDPGGRNCEEGRMGNGDYEVHEVHENAGIGDGDESQPLVKNSLAWLRPQPQASVLPPPSHPAP